MVVDEFLMKSVNERDFLEFLALFVRLLCDCTLSEMFCSWS